MRESLADTPQRPDKATHQYAVQIGNLTRNAIEEQLKKSGLKARALQKAKPTTTNNINISINIIAPTQGGTAIVN